MKPLNKEYLFIKDIRNGYFKINEDGKIWRIAIKHKYKKFIKILPREMGYINKSGYISISFRKDIKTYKYLAHRLVWVYFNGNILNNKQINHKDGIKTNNKLDNLEAITESENHKHAYRNGLIKPYNRQGENAPSVKLTNEDIKLIRNRYKNGEKQIKIAKDFNITPGYINNIIKRRAWTHLS